MSDRFWPQADAPIARKAGFYREDRTAGFGRKLLFAHSEVGWLLLTQSGLSRTTVHSAGPQHN